MIRIKLRFAFNSIPLATCRRFGTTRNLRQTINPTNEFKEEFKHAMSRISSQAMILTAGIPNVPSNSSDNINVLHGMTLSSVCSLSVYPKPLLQFNLHLPSYTSKALHDNEGYLAIHLLPPTSKSVRLSRIFASGIKVDPKHFNVNPIKNDDGSIFHEMTTPFNDISQNDYTLYEVNDNYKIPIINELERVFICNKEKVFEIDNHEIWVVNVSKILKPNENYDSDHSKTGGLLYYKRGFHKIGTSLQE